MKKLDKKVAIVTGASKGIGAEIAKGLAAEGASVIVNYSSSKEGADKVVASIVEKGGKAVAIHGNVSKPEDVDRLFLEAKKSFGDVNILVNNAGVYQFGMIEDLTVDEFNRQFNTNVLGLLLVTQGALKSFGEKGGSIINISSTVTRVTPPGSSIYTATKGAVDSITQVLSKELGSRKIRVNAINPGMVETEGAHTAGLIGSEFHTNIVNSTPLGRTGQPNDIAPVAVFLASDDSRWLTGETILASGGMR
ncbi:MAG: glucose 1-dehydrogenase [Bacteroidota bacterium]